MLATSVCIVGVVSLVVGVLPGPGAAATTTASASLRVGAFNIKSFGKTKMSDEDVAGQIKEIVERYDVLLIQEIRDKSVDSVRQLLALLDPPFDFVISKPIGRTSYKEQYAFFYRTDRVLLLGTYQYDDPKDVFEREPYTVKMAPKAARHEHMSLIGFHSRPRDATAEIGHLKDVISRVQEEFGSDSEPVVLGDLNADCSYANYDERMAANDYLTINTTYTWVIDDDVDTTVKTSTDCAYDRILMRSTLASRVADGSAIAFDFGQALGLNENEALAVSDHFPVEITLNF